MAGRPTTRRHYLSALPSGGNIRMDIETSDDADDSELILAWLALWTRGEESRAAKHQSTD